MAVIPDSDQIISGSYDKAIKVWCLKTGKELFTLYEPGGGGVKAVTMTPDGNWVVSGSDDTTIKIWNLQSRKKLFTLTSHVEPITSLVVTPDGEWGIFSSTDKTIAFLK
ncbi:MAG TPA: hypothetical protein V6C95_16545 [Coleofasciculaceae cyanobacterium]